MARRKATQVTRAKFVDADAVDARTPFEIAQDVAQIVYRRALEAATEEYRKLIEPATTAYVEAIIAARIKYPNG